MNTKQLGNNGEQHVAYYLQQHGFTIIQRNYAKRFAEVDIIARKGSTIAFVEVKARAHAQFDMSYLVNHRKQQKIINAAKTFLAEQKLINIYCRFDVALLIQNQDTFNLTYLENAFYEHE